VDPRGLCVTLLARRVAAEAIDRAVTRRRDDPSSRPRRQAGRRPLLDGDHERVLDRLLGGVDVSEQTDQYRDGAAVFLAKDTLDLRPQEASSRNGRTSIGSVVATASLRPHSSAASRSAALMMVKPPTYSFASMKGPSVMRASPSFTRTTVAVLGGYSPAP